MAWVIIEKFQQWSARRQELLASLVGIAVEGAASSVPIVGAVAGKVLGELARYGVKRMLEPQTEIPDVKKAGQPFPTEQIEQINAWLEILTTSYVGLLDRLEPLLTATNQGIEGLRVLVERTLLERAEFVQQFDASVKEVRRVTLSLAVVEDKLDRNFHEIHRVALAQEEIKAILIDSPLLADYARFRQAQPDAVNAIVQADAHFLAGQREEGISVLLGLLHRRGVGGETICQKLGLAYLGAGKVAEAAQVLDRAGTGAGGLPAPLASTRTRLSTAAARGTDLPVWRSLPRGFVVARKYRVEEEVGRGGMASVYRAIGVDLVNTGQTVAVKVPAPALMRDEHTRRRFLQEIRVSQRLSAARPPEIVQTLGYEVFDDPHTGGEMYGLVLEYIDGWSLAHVLARRQARQRPLSVPEILAVMRPVCRALDFAHGQNPPVLHRDVKPANVMVGRAGKPIKLMDFGIARVLEDRRQTWVSKGETVGTPAYMPPEFWEPQTQADPRSDVYLAGNLLLELMTFSAMGDPESRPDCPPGWVALIDDSMSRVRSRRPQSVVDFLARLDEAKPHTPPAVSSPETEPPNEPKQTVTSGSTGDEADGGRREPTLKVLARHGILSEGTEIELLREAMPDDGLQRDPNLFRARIGDLTSRHSVIWAHDNNPYSLTKLSIILERHGLQWFRGKTYELWRVVGQVESMWDQANRLLRQESTEPQKSSPVEVLANSLGMRLVLVPLGTFWMGGRGYQSQVEIPHDFYMSVFPVTQEQWQAVMGTNPSYHTSAGDSPLTVKGIPDHELKQFPVEQVSWDDVQEFLSHLNAREKNRGLVYRLPTEAEWEYASRGGVSSQEDCSFDFYCGEPSNDLSSKQANFNGYYPAGAARRSKYLSRTTKVGSYQPNRLGIYDLHGNVWEWCSDLYEAQGSALVVRGGGWHDLGSDCTASSRGKSEPSDAEFSVGLRVAAVLSGK